MFIIALLIIVALVVGVWAFNKWGGAEANKDNAIANAANQVGDAAQDVGAAAKDAADNTAH
jgi:agmatine/peptidylarginine deiminase